MLDAYTIKKMLPRLIIAVLLVNLSWFICTSLLATTSVVGNAIRDIMWSPFLRAGYDNTLSIGGKLTTLLWGGAAVGAFPAALWATIGGGWAVILSMILSIAAFLFLAVIVLTLREVVLVFLIIISPLALVAWVLPGTEQWAKRWWGLYSKLLLMFPAFMALLAAGEIMSTVTNKHKGGTDADPINNLIAIAMYMIPFFMLPFLFKAMGGFLGQVTGMINDREKGLVDRSKGWAREKRESSDLALQKKLGKANREQRQMSKLSRGVDELGEGARFRRTRNAWRSGVARRSAGVSLTDRIKEGVGIEDGSGMSGSERVAGLRADLKVRVDEEDMKRALQNIKVRISGMDASAAKEEINKMFNTAVEENNGVMVRAAMNQMTALKGVEELEAMHTAIATGQTLEGRNVGQSDTMMHAWNSGLQENYSDMKAMSPHLAIGLSDDHKIEGGRTSLDVQRTLEDQRRKAFLDANLDLLANMKKEGWERFRVSDGVAAAAKEAEVRANENIKSKLNV